ncbi:MAG: M48 family metalloprotease [Pseudonocardiaceae bacterium]
MTSLRALLALALLAGFYLVASALVLGYLLLIGFVVYTLFTSPHADFSQSGWLVWFVGGNAPVVVAIVHGMLMVSRSPGVLAGSVPLHRDDAPNLWDTVTELAKEVGAPVPSELRLTADANAAVSEDTRLLGFSVGARRMYIGVPLLVGLPTDELRAVLCHELGHYARGHTRFGAMTYRGSVALAATRERIRRDAAANELVRNYSFILRGVLAAYASLYDTVSLAVRRQQELEADAAAASTVGREVTSEALRSAHMLVTAWDDFCIRFLQPMRKLGQLPDDPFSAFEAMLDDLGYRDVLAQWRRNPPEQPKSPLDSHPGLGHRLARLAEGPSSSVARDGSPAKSVLTDPQELFVRVWNVARPPGSRGQPWQDWLGAIAEYQATEPARGLTQAAEQLGATPTLGGVLDLLEAGRASALSSALTDTCSEPDAPADVGRSALAAAVSALVQQWMVQAGKASWSVPWTGTTRLFAKNTTSAEILALVHAAVEKPTEILRLRLHLAALGLDADRPVTVTATQSTSNSGDVHVVVEAANVEEQRKIASIAVPAMGAMLSVIVLAVVYGADEPAPRSPGLAIDYGSGYPLGANQTFDLPSRNLQPLLAYPSLGCYQPNDYVCQLSNPAPQFTKHFVVVERGDNLSSIACRHQTTVDELVDLNALSSTDLAVGQHLFVPGLGSPVIAGQCG